MKYVTWLFYVAIGICLATWTRLWTWTYPLAMPSVSEVRTAQKSEKATLASIVESVRFAFVLPFMARSQHSAERSVRTSTEIPASFDAKSDSAAWIHFVYLAHWRSEPLWRMKLREALVWSTFASWAITWGSIGASFIFTGNFLFEVHETPEAAGYVSNYFKVSALAFALPFVWVTVGIAVLGLSRRRVVG